MHTHRTKLLLRAATATFAGTASVALGHGEEFHDAHSTRWTYWNWDPLIMACLAAVCAAYFGGLARLWGRAGEGRGVSVGQAVAFGGAIVALVASLLSPIDSASDQLQSVHMIQHMLIMMVAAPLFVLGSPAAVMIWSLPREFRQRAAAGLSRMGTWRPPWYLLWQPLLLWGLYALTLWVWHLPTLYEAALRNRWIHDLQHITFFVASCLFWRVLLDPISQLRLNLGLGVIYLFTTSLHAMLLGVFLALAPSPWYSEYIGRTDAWNLTALEDQQAAGLIMWMPACMIYAVVAAAIFAIWVRQTSRDQIHPNPVSRGGA